MVKQIMVWFYLHIENSIDEIDKLLLVQETLYLLISDYNIINIVI